MYYEAETIANGKTRDLLIDPQGAVVEVEQEVALNSIPAAAKSAIEKYASTGKILKVESVRKGTATTYEASVKKGAKTSEVSVTAAGAIQK